MRVLANIRVIAPADAYSTKTLLEQIVEEEGLFYIRIGRDYTLKVYDREELRIGKAGI
ncbi:MULTISPECIES: hypothetical protein [unclassified Thermococcus]|uniref:hypothetical protein n=1 Tax=unclassified Thermococcus TaxID=2627626 RepID=UPI001F110ABA|nr:MULTISPECIES: hypothetical protein [unclassified Thermococcus]